MAYTLPQSATNLSTNTTTVIPNLWTSHVFLAPNEYSLAAVGIHSCLVRCCESEHFAKCFYQGIITGLRTKDFIHRLNAMEKKLKNDCQVDIERCAMIARLRRYLKNNEKLFENILNQIKNHLDECMREDLPLAPPQTYDEFSQQCIHRNQAALVHDQAHRMRRFQFHDHQDANQPVNLINLQTWTQPHFQLLVDNITPNLPNRAELLTDLRDLLNNSFFIIQHPSPPIATTHGPARSEDVTAKIKCQLLCLLDRSNPAITIDNITPFVCCLSKSNQMEVNDVSYRQAQINWKSYSIVTALNNPKIFSGAELSEIVLNQMAAAPQRQQPPTGKTHYAQNVYRIDFHINVTVHFHNDPLPYQHCVIVQSAPFGLITNTCQEEVLFAEVFLEDLLRLKSIPTMSNITTSAATTMTNLTIEDIVDSIRRYFIHKTGIQPKQWVMPYIQQELSAVYNNNQNLMDNDFLNVLAKILAQIDYMAKHSLLILFHDDGLFLSICDSMLIDTILRNEHDRYKKLVCAMRFGSIHNMSNAKVIGVRIDLVDKSSTDVQRCTFETDKLSLELGSFMTKIALCKASCFENILSSITKNAQQHIQVAWRNMHVFVDLYDSEKLRKLCPHEKKYSSIWMHFDSKENKKPKDSGSSPIPNPSQNYTITTNTGASTNNNPNYSFNSNICTINRRQQVMQSPQLQYYPQPQYLQQIQYSQIPQHAQQTQYLQQTQYSGSLQPEPQYYPHSQTPLQVQTSCTNSPNILQSPLTSSYTPQNNQQFINTAPIVIVITAANQFTMSHQDITQFISYRLPEYSSFIQTARVHHLNFDPLSQPSNAPVQTLQNSFPNTQSMSLSSEQSIIYPTNTTDPTNFPVFDNNN